MSPPLPSSWTNPQTLFLPSTFHNWHGSILIEMLIDEKKTLNRPLAWTLNPKHYMRRLLISKHGRQNVHQSLHCIFHKMKYFCKPRCVSALLSMLGFEARNEKNDLAPLRNLLEILLLSSANSRLNTCFPNCPCALSRSRSLAFETSWPWSCAL